MRRLKLIFALVLLTSSSVVAEAQANPRQLADANRAAMDAYNNLEIEVAKETLEKAIAGAESNGLTGSGLARTYANLGVVLVGGLSDSAAALDAFIRALQEDGSVEPDPLVSTPEVLQVFAQAKRKAGQGGGKRSKPTPAPAPAPVAVEGDLEHVPAGEQLKNTDLPVYVAASNPEIASMKIFYRSVGMPKPKSAAMVQATDGFTYLIPCADVFEPNVEYFIVAFDAAGEKIGTAGSPENPVSVPVVAVRSQPAPSLPGEVPPSQCGGGEEAAAVSTTSVAAMGHEGSLGDTCTSDSQCGEGLVCFDNFCAMGERKKDDDDDDDESDGDAARFYIDLGAGVALVMVSNNSAADTNPPEGVARDASNAAGAQSGEQKIQTATDYASAQGWNCKVQEVSGGSLSFSNCKTTVAAAGFVGVPVLNGNVGYIISDRFALEGQLRIPLKHGSRSMSAFGIGARAEILLTELQETGFHAGLLGGVLIGTVSAQAPAAKAATVKGPYATSGPFGLQLGMRLGYQFARNVGFMVTPVADLMFGDFLFALDLTGNLRIAF
ncbi:MAG: hypothetical protein QM778_03105 [Myxococcales bacterium]